MTKQCTKCKITKHYDFFYKNAKKPKGIQSNCKECQDAATKKWREGKGKNKYKSYQKSIESYEKHKMRNKKRAKAYRDDMNDNYIRGLIAAKSNNLKPEDIPQELIDVWKINLKLKRALGKTQINKNKEK